MNSLYTAVAEPTVGVIDCQPIIDERESRNSESVPDNNTEMQGNREPTIYQREGRDKELVPDSNSETEGKCLTGYYYYFYCIKENIFLHFIYNYRRENNWYSSAIL